MLLGKNITEAGECPTKICRAIGPLRPVMEMDLYLTQPFCLQFRQPLEQGRVILLRRIKVSVPERCSIAIPNGLPDRARLFAPVVKP